MLRGPAQTPKWVRFWSEDVALVNGPTPTHGLVDELAALELVDELELNSGIGGAGGGVRLLS